MLKVNEVHKTFFAATPNEVRALQGVSLQVEASSFVVVIGTNGSGKSTLLNAIAGTFALDDGTIELSGQNVTHWQEHRRAKLIGRVFQNPFSGTAPSMTVAENLSLAAKRGRRRGLGPALSPRIRRELRDKVASAGLNLENRLDTPIGNLSGGQRQSLTLIMAGLIKPKLLLLDEHTAALDPKSADQVIRLTKEMIELDQLTAVMITHSMQQAAKLGDRLIMMDRGRVVHELRGSEKRNTQPSDLLAKFEELRRIQQLDESAAEMLRRNYI